MSVTKDKGNQGESIAKEYLESIDYTILHENWRYKHGEIDLIVKHNEILIFVEVKARSNPKFGQPETFVDEKKQAKIIETAQAYLEEYKHEGEIRFDIISVDLSSSRNQVKHFPDAFF